MTVLKAQFSERYYESYESYESLQNSIDTAETMPAPQKKFVVGRQFEINHVS